jgi:serine/threonine protein kinase
MDRNYFRFLDSTLRSEHSDSDDDDDDGGGGDDDDDDDVLAGIRNIQRSAFNQGYYAHFFREGRKLGRGARGSVFLAQHILQNELLGEYAVKKVPVGDDAGWLARMLREVHVMESLRHPNTVIYKHTWLEVAQLTVFGPPVPCLFILMEYANGGNLEEFIEAEVIGVNDVRGGGKKSDEPNLLPIDEVLAVFLGICRGLEHLHRFGIIHRDLKPSNILLHYHQQDRVTRPDVLLSDFGECNEIAAEHGRSRTGATGTIEFCAPELFRCNEQGYYYVEHSTMTDVWSLGMILYFLLFGGRLPYADIEDVDVLRNDMLAMERVVLPGTRKDVPLEIIGLLQRLLSTGPEERPSATQAVRTVEVSLLRQAEKRSRSPSRSPLLIAAPREAKKHGIQRKLVVPEWPLYAGVVCLLCGVCYPKSASWILMVIAVICFVIRKHLQSSLLLSMTICIIAGGILYAINGSICAC